LPGLLYAQVQKIQRRRRLVRVDHQMLCGSAEAFSARLRALGLSGHIQTAFIERVNLTLRRSLAPLARRSWSLAQLPGELLLHLEWWRAYYHFVRAYQALRRELAQPCPPWRSAPGPTLCDAHRGHGRRSHSVSLVGLGGA
jgi:transposase InsO family protein